MEKQPQLVRYQDNLHLIAFKLMKLLPASYIIEKAETDGQIDQDTTIIETSSGTFALGLAIVCALKKYKLIIVGDPVIDVPLRNRLNDLGAQVEIVTKSAAEAGYQSARLKRVFELMDSIPNHFWPCQYDNSNHPEAYADLAKAVYDRLGQIDYLVGTVGSGGSLCGMSRVMKQINPSLRSVGVDTNGSVLFGQPDSHRLLRGLGNSIIPKNLDYSLIDEVHWVTPECAFNAARRLHREKTLFMGPTSGASLFVAEYISRLNPDRKVAAILPDEGTRYLHTVYDNDWLAKHGIVSATDHRMEKPRKINGPEEAGTDWTVCEWGGRHV